MPPLRVRLGRLPRLAVPRTETKTEKEEAAQMNDRTKYPRGSPKDILIRLRRIEHEIEQTLRDVRSVNDTNPNFADKPMDTGRYLVQLKTIRGVITEVRAHVKAGAPTLPGGIIDPILTVW